VTKTGQLRCQRVCQSDLYVLSRGASPAKATSKASLAPVDDP
jgi:hypothetical protein